METAKYRVYRRSFLAPRVLVALLLMLGVVGFLNASDQVPPAKQDHPIALVGGTVHTVSGDVIENATVVFLDGKITAIGIDVALPQGAEKIDVSGKHVYPVMIDANTALGLVEVSAVRSTRDFGETGSITPEVRAVTAFNPDSELLPVTRSSGVAIALSVPRGGLISGTSSLMMLDGWTGKEMAITTGNAVHIRWPNMSPVTAWWMSKSKEEQIKERDEQLAKLDEILANARAYQKAQESEMPGLQSNLRLQVMARVVQGGLPLFIHADDLKQIQAAINWSKTQNVKMVLVGGYDSWRVAHSLKENNIAVILEGVHRLPSRRWEGYDEPFTVAKKLSEAGVRFCIAGSGSPFEAAHVRNLPYQAATAVAYGLPKDQGLKAVTLFPAEILGVGDRIGSLEVGKDASLMITDGDPLEITTDVHHMFLQGRPVDLSNRHTQLYEKYRQKYQQLKLLEAGE